MASWSSSSKGGIFEYACSFSVDEGIEALYRTRATSEHVVVEVRTNFYCYVKGKKKEEKRWVGSERFGTKVWIVRSELWIERAAEIHEVLGERLRDYWLSPPQIKELLDAALLISGGRSTVLDLTVVTTVEEEEEAMRPLTLRPLDLTHPFLINPNRTPDVLFRSDPIPSRDEIPSRHEHPQWEIWVSEYLGALGRHLDRRAFLKSLYEKGVRVDGDDHGTAMQACGICGGKPFIGTIIARLRCAHLFHYHCIVWHLKDHCACPIPTCAHPPFDLKPNAPPCRRPHYRPLIN
ncbi:hypothetical protein OROGR_015995 [Orobanche gracilis]